VEQTVPLSRQSGIPHWYGRSRNADRK